MRRAGLSQFWAGLVAVTGLATSVFRDGYLATHEYGLLVEGVTLLVVGVGADRLRRRLDRSRTAGSSTAEPLDPVPAA
jgi:hypothetical protein